MQIITRRFEFDAAHRVLGHTGKCRFLHGHRYVVEVSVTAKQLDDLHMIIDFSVMKDVIGKWIDDNLDHNILLHPDDNILKLNNVAEGCPVDLLHLVFGSRIPFTMPPGLENPTAENIATLILIASQTLMNPFSLTVTNVKVFETPNCSAVVFSKP